MSKFNIGLSPFTFNLFGLKVEFFACFFIKFFFLFSEKILNHWPKQVFGHFRMFLGRNKKKRFFLQTLSATSLRSF